MCLHFVSCLFNTPNNLSLTLTSTLFVDVNRVLQVSFPNYAMLQCYSAVIANIKQHSVLNRVLWNTRTYLGREKNYNMIWDQTTQTSNTLLCSKTSQPPFEIKQLRPIINELCVLIYLLKERTYSVSWHNWTSYLSKLSFLKWSNCHCFVVHLLVLITWT